MRPVGIADVVMDANDTRRPHAPHTVNAFRVRVRQS